ncbi:transcriptional regulator [Actinomadura spongiicola]|uniref:Transcriptional regulator n=1 Tax=Actinomadura spongiicola TaxID=2303421 RepID=A0A372GDX4_9ACTN|nr:helix-turn-helix domain-containing protein [Actinomadura spongiicola]RFS83402.1 transcriptional regulator [Actinomadura spongiicola]
MATADPVTEALFALRFLQQRGERGMFRQWRVDVRARISGSQEVSLLAPLLPPGKLAFDLFTLCGLTGSVDGAVETLRGRTVERLSAEVAHAAAVTPLPGWTRHVAAADREWIDLLGTAVRGAHRATVAPYWPQIRACLNTERGRHGRALADFGVERLLASLHPSVRWRPPVLEMPSPHAREFRLGGRGMVVIPSMFCRPLPAPMLDYPEGEGEAPELWLFVPVADVPGTSPASLTDRAADGDALATLLGRTRAAVLRAVAAGPVTTGGLARRAGVSISVASQQAAVLRDAGLIVTRRVGKAVLHTTTTTGDALLADGGIGPSSTPLTTVEHPFSER